MSTKPLLMPRSRPQRHHDTIMTQSSRNVIAGQDVRRACQALTAAGESLTVTAVARHLGASRATLYRHPELRAALDETVARPMPTGANGSFHRPASGDIRRRVEQACAGLLSDGQAVTFVSVAERSGLGRATLYRHPELRELIAQLRWGPALGLAEMTQAVELDDLRSEFRILQAQLNRQEIAIRQLIAIAAGPCQHIELN